MQKKYKLTKTKKEMSNKTLYQIQALRDFGDVKKGDLGGWLETESNLSHEGDCWISENACVYDRAYISGNAQVCGAAMVYGIAYLTYGKLTQDILKDMRTYIACSLNVLPIKGKYILYKRVNKLKKGLYASCWNKNFLYRDGKIAKVSRPFDDKLTSCGDGLHVSTPYYWTGGDTLIACEVHERDIITCMEGKLRVKKLKVLEEI